MILIVDDDKASLLMMKNLVEKMGFQAETAENGMEAVQKAKSIRFVAVFLDIHMDGLDGYDTARLIHELDKEVRIIALSADGIDDSREESVYFRGYLSKPVNPENLKEIIAMKQPEKHNRTHPDSEDEDLNRQYAGIDIYEAVERFSENEPLYLQLLTDFSNQYYKQIMLLQSLYQEGYIDQLREKLHSLKGLTGNLSLKGLYQQVCRIQDKIHQKKNVSVGDFKKLNQEYQVVKESLEKLKKDKRFQKKERRKPDITFEELMMHIGQVKQKLCAHDLETLDIWKEVLKNVKDFSDMMMKIQVDEITDLIQVQLDFETSYEKVSELEKSLYSYAESQGILKNQDSE